MNKKILIKKGLVVTVILLFIGLAIAPSINANVSKASIESEMVKITTENLGGHYLIFGTGDISWLNIENESWRFGGKYRGLYRAKIIFHNGPGMYGLGYCFFIKDLNSGEIFNKETLPRHIYLNDFFGYFRANYYSHPYGPTGFFFTILGFADNYYE